MSDDLPERLRFARGRIAEHIAERLGFGSMGTMPAGLRRRLDEEVGEALSAWRQASDLDPGLVPRTRIQHLLAAHVEIERDSRL